MGMAAGHWGAPAAIAGHRLYDGPETGVEDLTTRPAMKQITAALTTLVVAVMLAAAAPPAQAGRLRNFHVADRGDRVVASWEWCAQRPVRALHWLHIWGTSAATESEQALWEPTLRYPRGCRRRRVSFPYFVVSGPYAAQLRIKVPGGRAHLSRVRHFRVEG
jgi:hypothetical protein